MLFNLIIFILVPFIGGICAVKLHIPRMIGYIIAGTVLGIFIHGQSAVFLPLFANVGLILLLFTVGLELNIDNLRRFGKFVILMGALQLIVSWLILYIFTILFGFKVLESAVIAFAFSLSSTAIVSKVIQDKAEENSLFGSMTLGILLFQDIAVIPFMILLSSLKGGGGFVETSIEIVFSFIKAAGILIVIYLLGQKIIPLLFEKIARLSRELLKLLTLLFIVIAIFVFSLLGLSPALAGFIAGAMLSGSLQHYQIFSQMRPMRDIFTILFFVFLGATVDVRHIISDLPKTLFFVFIIMLTKFLVISIIFIYYRFHSKTAFTTGILLSQVGEFAFIILHQSSQDGILSQDAYMFSLSVTLLTIMLSPLFMDRKEKVYLWIRRIIKKYASFLERFISYRVDRDTPHIDALKIRDHVIICGYGRVGSYIGRALNMSNIPFIAIDMNYHIVEEQRKRGVNIIYGDPTDIDILDFAQVEYASAIISAVPDIFSQEMIILNSKTLNSKITVFSRVELEKHQQRIKDLGAEVVVQPEFEAALSIIKRILVGYSMHKKDIVGKIKRLKLEHGMI